MVVINNRSRGLLEYEYHNAKKKHKMVRTKCQIRERIRRRRREKGGRKRDMSKRTNTKKRK